MPTRRGPGLRGDATDEVKADDERVVRAYLRLCEDQLELRRLGWISTSTWAIWIDLSWARQRFIGITGPRSI
ncbi:hypothetical protein Amsp01_058080 [Amycolatopsis sp. NBRC 101858]|uniref:hypothetical protein n=1 Tax=Amycolatopsis sp. NBRC 101858 TaxID=3032200 RepID=UPI0024A1DA20|nr:hypothetical protein [Amycolatopsis sp. NBRC 101858]GLY39785.1 hypothetical protein Amsp01_058080 [Amycolatopsis sp. NBRC 101858]